MGHKVDENRLILQRGYGAVRDGGRRKDVFWRSINSGTLMLGTSVKVEHSIGRLCDGVRDYDLVQNALEVLCLCLAAIRAEQNGIASPNIEIVKDPRGRKVLVHLEGNINSIGNNLGVVHHRLDVLRCHSNVVPHVVIEIQVGVHSAHGLRAWYLEAEASILRPPNSNVPESTQSHVVSSRAWGFDVQLNFDSLVLDRVLNLIKE